MESKPVCMPKFEGKLKGGFKVDVCQSFGENCRVDSKLTFAKVLGAALGWIQCV